MVRELKTAKADKVSADLYLYGCDNLITMSVGNLPAVLGFVSFKMYFFILLQLCIHSRQNRLISVEKLEGLFNVLYCCHHEF